MFTKQEKQNIRSFCQKIGTIRFPKNPTLVENTAAGELRTFLQGFHPAGTGTLFLGTPGSNAAICALCQTGKLTIGEVCPEDDGFEIKWVDGDLVVAGANPRGVLYGVYELQDRILAGDALEAKVVPAFRKRSEALGHYHNGRTFNFGNDHIDDRKVSYLARLRINQFCACCDGSPIGSHLCDFVHSDVFPFMRKPSPDAITQLKNTATTFARYGIDFIMMLWEPAIPSLFAPVEAYPEEALGTVRRPWGGDENHLDRTLCLNSPLVQAHYRNIIAKFIRQFPEVRGIFVYNMDGGSWLCTPELCPRCKETIVDSDPALFNPWETQAALIRLLGESIQAVDPSFTFNFWAQSHFHGESIKKMLDAADSYNYLTCGSMSGDHDLFVTGIDQPTYEVAASLEAVANRGHSAYVVHGFNKHESVQPGLPTPFAIAEAIQTFKRWGFKNLMETSGPTPALNQITALTMRQFQSEPDTDPQVWLKALADKQYGPEAGPHLYAAWEEIQKALVCWRDYPANPFRGSNFLVRIGLTSSYNGVPSILPGILEQFEEFYYDILAVVEPWRMEEFRRNQTPEFLERFRQTEAHLAAAQAQARIAVEKADGQSVAISYYNGAFEGISRHTRFEHARLNLCAIRMSHSMSRQVIHMLQAVAIFGAMRENPSQKDALQLQYLQLLREDRQVLGDYISMLEEFLQLRPCLAMSGMCENEIVIYMEDAQARLDGIDRHLAENSK